MNKASTESLTQMDAVQQALAMAQLEIDGLKKGLSEKDSELKVMAQGEGEFSKTIGELRGMLTEREKEVQALKDKAAAAAAAPAPAPEDANPAPGDAKPEEGTNPPPSAEDAAAAQPAPAAEPPPADAQAVKEPPLPQEKTPVKKSGKGKNPKAEGPAEDEGDGSP